MKQTIEIGDKQIVMDTDEDEGKSVRDYLCEEIDDIRDFIDENGTREWADDNCEQYQYVQLDRLTEVCINAFDLITDSDAWDAVLNDNESEILEDFIDRVAEFVQDNIDTDEDVNDCIYGCEITVHPKERGDEDDGEKAEPTRFKVDVPSFGRFVKDTSFEITVTEDGFDSIQNILSVIATTVYAGRLCQPLYPCENALFFGWPGAIANIRDWAESTEARIVDGIREADWVSEENRVDFYEVTRVLLDQTIQFRITPICVGAETQENE